LIVSLFFMFDPYLMYYHSYLDQNQVQIVHI
jgi:hypothetical protein